MAQSALKDSGKSPLGIQPFWEKATLEPPLRWEYWRTQLKVAILAREGIVVYLLLADRPEPVILHPIRHMRMQSKTLQHNQNEINALVTNKQRRHGKLIVNKLRRWAFYAEINRGNFVIEKHLH